MVTPEAVIRKTRQDERQEKAALTKKEILDYYRMMLLIRRFEEKAGQLYGMGLIGGFCHLYIGQEAVVAGLQSCIAEGDAMITSYRDHGHILACGSDPKVVFAELMGRETGCSKGKGGSMHLFDLDRGFYGGHGIVGAPVPIGTGIAFAMRYRESNHVCLVYFGDGAANQGQIYESFNMAELWKLPAIYIVENNEYAMGTSVARSSATTELYQRGKAFGIEGRQVDGMDFFAVREAGLMAVDHVRSGKGPILLEMKTYRYRGHSMSDPAKYRSREEVEHIRERRDPIQHLRDYIVKNEIGNQETLKVIDSEVKARINEAVEFSMASPEPEASELYTNVYAEAGRVTQ